MIPSAALAAPDQFDKPFFFTYNIPRSIGEAKAVRYGAALLELLAAP